MNYPENAIEWLTGQNTITASFSQKKMINRMMKLKEEHPDEVSVEAVNEDGSILAKFPLKWLRITPSRELTEEERKIAAERFEKIRIKREKEQQKNSD